MSNILVTGGAGYIGSNMIDNLLSNKNHVTCVDYLKFGIDPIHPYLNHDNFKFYNCDINDHISFNKILLSKDFDVVIHLAAIVGDPACKLYSDEATKTNYKSTIWLIDKCIEIGIARFIFASTCSNYGKSKNPNEHLTEDSELLPVSLYANLKVDVENYLLNEIKKTHKFCPTIMRFSTVYGLSQRMRFDLTVNEFTKELSLNRELVVFGEQFWRPYCHVDDFGNAINLVMNSPEEKVAYNVYNVGDTSENYTKKMLINEIKKVIPQAKIKYVKKNEDPRDYKVDCDKIRNELNFNISKNVKDGIREIHNHLINSKIKDPDDQKYFNIPIK